MNRTVNLCEALRHCCIGMCVASAVLVAPGMAYASLGEPETSVQTDMAKFHGEVKIAERGVYRVHEIQLPSGTAVREYAGSDGKVFAVVWRGPFAPDLHQILGKYFENYLTAAQFNARDHHHLQIRQSDLVVDAHGHMRAFRGVAYLPQSLPFGVAAGELR